jgi:hypothetical protein
MLTVSGNRTYLLADSPGQAGPTQEVLKPWIGAQWVKTGPHEHLRVKALRVCRFQPNHGLILLAQAYEDQGDYGSV